MKKSILTLGLMFAALTLTNCTKNEEENIVPEIKGQAFEIFAVPDTRTANDGLSTKWADGDALNVFHAVAGTTEYKNNGSFAIKDVDNGSFTGTLIEELDEMSSYDWYLFYPYLSYIKDPVNDNGGYATIGSKSNESQSQDSTDSMSHIAGANYPLYGKATVAATTNVEVKMNHLTSVIAVNVTNNESETITVNKISFETSSNNIVGTYYINFAGEDIKYTSSGDNYVSKKASLTVTNAEVVAEKNAKFYLGIKPFTAAVGETLTITVSTDKGDCVKTLTLQNETTFTAGKIKTLNFGFVAPEPQPDKIYELVTDASTLAAGDQVIIVAADDLYALGAQRYSSSTPSNRSGISITKNSDGNIINPSADVVVMNLENGSSTVSGTSYAFNLGEEGYLAAVSSSNNYLATNSTKTLNCSWTINIENNNASIIAQGNYTRKYLRYNPNSGTPIFACYSSASQKSVQIYRLQDDRESLVKPAITVTPDNTNKSITVSWKTVDNATSYVVSCTGQTEQTFNAAGEYTFSGLEYGKYTVAVAVSADGYRSASASEEVEIIDYNLAAPEFTSVTGTTETITAKWNAVTNATSYGWELYKGTDKETGTLVQNGTYTPDDLTAATVTLTISGTFAEGEQYALYVKSAAEAPFIESAPAKSEAFEIKAASAEPELITYSIDFENTADTYTDWTFNNFMSQQSGTISSNGGTYYGTTGGKTTGYLQFNSVMAKPKSLTFFISKQSNNTTSSTWIIQQSTDGSNWTDLKSQSATSMAKGTWNEISIDLSGYNDIYIRIYYTGSTAVRNIDDVTLVIEK